MLHGRRIGVTGVTGFLGSHLAEGLLACGADVVGIVRDPARAEWLEARGIALRTADLLDPASLASAFTGLDAVVSNAALASEPAGHDLEAFAEGDRRATTHVVDAALAVGVTRLVHVSSVAVYRIRWPCTRIREDHPRRGRGTHLDINQLVNRRGYADGKARSEEVVWAATARGLRPTVLRPGPIYGSRDPKLTARYRRAMEGRVRIVPTVGVPHVHAGDVAKAAAGALANDASIGRAYNVTGEPESLWGLLKTVRELAGTGPWLIPVPIPLWVGWDNDAARADLGVVFRPLRDGLAEALRS
jgi:nucleoside-diphosphate-sugar epimerase